PGICAKGRPSSPPSLTRMPQLHSQRIHAVAFHSAPRSVAVSVVIGPPTSRYLLDTRAYTLDTMPSTASRSPRRYHHFCPAARALETIGERWSLLIVRDLLAGPRRFSDLRRSLAAITPKWLSARLRTLEADGIVTRDGTGGGEVRCRLTPRGKPLEPVFDALLVWGMDYALGSPRHGEAIHPGRAIDATVRYLNRRRVRAARRVVWAILFGEDRSYTIRFDGARWSRQRGA